jgi:hypothetical protein
LIPASQSASLKVGFRYAQLPTAAKSPVADFRLNLTNGAIRFKGNMLQKVTTSVGLEVLLQIVVKPTNKICLI